MSRSKTRTDKLVAFRADRSFFAALQEEATKDERNVSQMARILIRQGLEARRAQSIANQPISQNDARSGLHNAVSA